MNNETTVPNLSTPVAALSAAIEQFHSRAEFWRVLMERTKQPITRTAITQWIRRGKGAPASMCPDIEAISSVPCEQLCPEVNWGVLRKTVKPPVFVKRALDRPRAMSGRPPIVR